MLEVGAACLFLGQTQQGEPEMHMGESCFLKDTRCCK